MPFDDATLSAYLNNTSADTGTEGRSDVEMMDDNDDTPYQAPPPYTPSTQYATYQAPPQQPQGSFLERAGHTAVSFGKEFLRDMNFLEPGIGTRERLFRVANDAAFLLPPLKVGETAALGVRLGVKALESGAITGGLAAIRGTPIVQNAVAGGAIGAGVEALLSRYHIHLNAARAADATPRFATPDAYSDVATTPLHNQPWAVMSAENVAGNGVKLRDPMNAARHQQLGDDLRRLGYQPMDAMGYAAGSATGERNYMVPGMDRGQAMELAKAYGQKHVLTNDGLIDLDEQTIAPINRTATRFGSQIDPAADVRTEIPGMGSFALQHDAPTDFSGAALQPLTSSDARMDDLRGTDQPSVVDRMMNLPVRSTLHSWYIRTVRSFAEVERLENMLGKPDEGLSLSNLVQLTAGSSAYAHAAVEHYVPDWADRAVSTSPSLVSILSKLKPGEFDTLDRYGFAKYFQHLAQDRDFQLPVLSDGTRLTQDDLADIITRTERDNPHLVDIRNQAQAWREAVMKETLMRSGVMSEPTYNAIVNSSDSFVPIRRAFESFARTARDDYAPGMKIISNPIGRVGALGGKLSPWLDSMVKDASVWSKLGHEQRFISALVQKLEAEDPSAAALFAKRVDLPAGTLAKWQKEALAAMSQTDPALAANARTVGGEMADLFMPARARQEGIIGALMPHTEAFYEHADTHERLTPEQYASLQQTPTPADFTLNATTQVMKNRLTGAEIPLRQWDDLVANGKIANSDAFDVADKPLPRRMQTYTHNGSNVILTPGEYAAALKSGKIVDDLDKYTASTDTTPRRVWYKVTNPDLWEAFHAMQPAQQSLFVKLAGSVASTLRAGATLAFEFMLRNPIKDVMTAKTLDGSLTLPEYIKGFAHAMKQDDVYAKWLASGAGRATFVGMDRDATREMLGSAMAAATNAGHLQRIGNMLKTPKEMLQALSDFMESGTRVGVFQSKYKQLVATGMLPEEALQRAAVASRNATVDFAIHGSRTQSLRMISAFWNAGMQGYDNLVRQFATDPRGATMRALAMITVPSIGLYLVNRHDPEYYQLPDWERNMFWHIKVPANVPWVGDKWMRVPKPFDLGTFFGTSVERFLQFADTNDPTQLDALARSVMSQIEGDLIPFPTVAKPIVESAINKSFLTDRPIESRALADIAPEYRTTALTTNVAQQLGHWLGVSPIQIDHFIGGYTGGVGRLATDIADAVVNMHEHGVAAPVFDPRQMPGLRGFFSQFPKQAEPVDKFYDAADTARQAEATRAHLESTLQLDDMAEWMQRRAVPIAMSDAIKGAQDELKQMRDMRDLILANHTMDRQQRADMLDQISRQMLEYASSYKPLIQMLAQHN